MTKRTAKTQNISSCFKSFKTKPLNLSSPRKNSLKKITKLRKWKSSKNYPLGTRTFKPRLKSRPSMSFKNSKKNSPIEKLILTPGSRILRLGLTPTTKSECWRAKSPGRIKKFLMSEKKLKLAKGTSEISETKFKNWQHALNKSRYQIKRTTKIPLL